MTKEEAYKVIENIRDEEEFVGEIRVYKRNRNSCDLCGKEQRDFEIRSKLLSDLTAEKYGLRKQGTQHIWKHICADCFIKLFPNEVLGGEDVCEGN